MKTFAFIWKWTFCIWAHRSHRCKPTVWGPETAKEWGIPYRPNAWHCAKCHPCSEGLEKLFNDQRHELSG